MLNQKVSKAVRLALALGAASTAVFSTNTFSAESDVERIEVTGSSIKGTDLAGALPIDVISAEDIRATGVTSVPDLINQIPSMQGFTTPTSSVGGGGGGTATASLRGIGEEYTLVLLNGRRLAPSDSGGTIDLNGIPLASIQRVEILTDGASALYGSDAIAGVINFILKKGVDQSTVSLRTDQPSGGGESHSFSFTTGFGDIDSDGYSLMLSLSHDKQEMLRGNKRDFAQTGFLEFKHNFQDYYRIKGSPNAIPANAELVIGEGDTAENLSFNPYLLANGSCAPLNAKDANTDNCMFDYTSTIEIIPESERSSILVQADFAINDDLNAFATLGFTDFVMTPRIAPNPTGPIPLPISSPLFTKYIAPHLTAEQAENVTDFRASWRALPGGNRTNEWASESLNSIWGLEGVLFDTIDFNTAIVYSESTRTETIKDGHFYRTFRDEIGKGLIDIFATLDEFDDASLQALNATKWVGLNTTTDTESLSFDFRASQALFEMSGGDAYIGYGADYRINSYTRIRSEENIADTRWLDSGGDRDYELERTTYGVFSELQLPVLDDLIVSAAIRYDEIGSVKDKSIGVDVNEAESDVTYKVSFRYTASDDLVLRGSIGTGFRAASLRQIAEPRVRFGVTGAPYNCPFTGADPRSKGCRPTAVQYNVFREGNASLAPETSDQVSLGFVYAPSNEFSFEMDYWSIDISEQVSSPSQPYMWDPQNAGTLFNDQFILAADPNDPNRNLLHSIEQPVNIGFNETAGVDWKVSLTNELSFGSLKSMVQGTYITKSDYTEAGTADVWTSSLGRYGSDEEVVFRNVINAQTTLTHGDFSHTLRMNFRSGWRDAAETAQRGTISNPELDSDGDLITENVQLKIPSHQTFSYRTDYYGVDDLVVSFGVKNIFDKAPPFSLGDPEGHIVGYEGRYYDQFLRTYYVSLDYSF